MRDRYRGSREPDAAGEKSRAGVDDWQALESLPTCSVR
jgi:hypothetical protein